MEIKKISFLIFLSNIRLYSKCILSPKRVMIFAGLQATPQKKRWRFSEKSGISVDVIFGGLDLSSLRWNWQRGRPLFPGHLTSWRWPKERPRNPRFWKGCVYLVPAINVQKGNPKWIHTIKDLAKEECVSQLRIQKRLCGNLCGEIVEKNLDSSHKEKFKKNLVNYTESCEKTANSSPQGSRCCLGWRVFQYWILNGSKQSIWSQEDTQNRIYSNRISKFTQNKALAQNCWFPLLPDGKTIFRKYTTWWIFQSTTIYEANTPREGIYLLMNGGL